MVEVLEVEGGFGLGWRTKKQLRTKGPPVQFGKLQVVPDFFWLSCNYVVVWHGSFRC